MVSEAGESATVSLSTAGQYIGMGVVLIILSTGKESQTQGFHYEQK